MSWKLAFAVYVLSSFVWGSFEFFYPKQASSYFIDNRECFFTSLLGIAVFVFTLKDFIISRMEERLSNSSYYKYLHERSSQSKVSRYQPVKQLNQIITEGEAACFISALLFISIGMLNLFWTRLICMGFVLTTLFLIIKIWHLVKENLDSYFRILEKDERSE